MLDKKISTMSIKAIDCINMCSSNSYWTNLWIRSCIKYEGLL